MAVAVEEKEVGCIRIDFGFHHAAFLRKVDRFGRRCLHGKASTSDGGLTVAGSGLLGQEADDPSACDGEDIVREGRRPAENGVGDGTWMGRSCGDAKRRISQRVGGDGLEGEN